MTASLGAAPDVGEEEGEVVRVFRACQE